MRGVWHQSISFSSHSARTPAASSTRRLCGSFLVLLSTCPSAWTSCREQEAQRSSARGVGRSFRYRSHIKHAIRTVPITCRSAVSSFICLAFATSSSSFVGPHAIQTGSTLALTTNIEPQANQRCICFSVMWSARNEILRTLGWPGVQGYSRGGCCLKRCPAHQTRCPGHKKRCLAPQQRWPAAARSGMHGYCGLRAEALCEILDMHTAGLFRVEKSSRVAGPSCIKKRAQQLTMFHVLLWFALAFSLS